VFERVFVTKGGKKMSAAKNYCKPTSKVGLESKELEDISCRLVNFDG